MRRRGGGGIGGEDGSEITSVADAVYSDHIESTAEATADCIVMTWSL